MQYVALLRSQAPSIGVAEEPIRATNMGQAVPIKSIEKQA